MSRSSQTFMCHQISKLEGQLVGWGLCTPFSPYASSAHGAMLSRDRPDIVMTTFCAHHFFYSFNASDGSERTNADGVVSPRYIMVLHGVRSEEVRRDRKLIIDYAKQHHTPQRWMPAKAMYPANSLNRFSCFTHSTSIFFVVNVQIYYYHCDSCHHHRHHHHHHHPYYYYN